MTKTTWTHVCKHQRGRWPIDNELVLCHPEGGEPQTLRIVETSPIHTAPSLSGKPDYVFCRCEPDKNTWDTFSDRQQDYLYENKLFVDPIVEISREEDADDDPPSELCDE